MKKKKHSDPRTWEQIREHYEVERELADQLRYASKEERRKLYVSVYNELFKRVPHHPQLSHKASAEYTAREVARKMLFLRPFLHSEATFLEIGTGDCALAWEVARTVKKSYGIDVSIEIAGHMKHPNNFQLLISDGCTIPLEDNSVDVAYSDQLMEHLHPDDAFEQLQEIHRVLQPGGMYLCVTPLRLSGPHDVSRHFDTVATGFHLKEYTVSDLCDLFKQVGFNKVVPYIGTRGIYISPPVFLVKAHELIVSLLPRKYRYFATYHSVRVMGRTKATR